MSTENLERKYKPRIIGLSIAIPVAVAALVTISIDGYDTSFPPPIYAGINGLTALVLVSAVIAIKNKTQQLHQRLMTTSVVLSALFLVLYVIYHATSDSTPYGGEGIMRTIYFILLISHILLSIGIIPLVLITYVRALSKRFDRHKKIARITFPIWLYVAVSGVLVYIMISPYYV
jgi:putative membrane protein